MAKIQRYFWDGTKWEPEEHTHNTSDITEGTLGVARGGTGLSTVTSNSYLKGSGTGALVPRTYTQVKNDLSLNNVENKTSATIRGEITSANVTSALGFTPYNSTNPSGYQKNSDITKAEIEAKLTGPITSHTHSQYLTNVTKGMVENVLTGNITSHTHSQYLTSFTETDPTVPSHVKNITSSNISSWNNKATTSYVNGKTDLKSSTDNRAVNTIPNDYNAKLDIKGLKSNTTLGITGQGSYSALLGIRGWTNSSGGNSHEFALTGDGEIYHRHGATTTWNPWDVLAKQSWVTANTRSNTWTPTWSQVTGKPTTFTPSSHTHAISQITGLQTELNNNLKRDGSLPMLGDLDMDGAHVIKVNTIDFEQGGSIGNRDGSDFTIYYRNQFEYTFDSTGLDMGNKAIENVNSISGTNGGNLSFLGDGLQYNYSGGDVVLDKRGFYPELNMDTGFITNLRTPTLSSDAATKGYVDGKTGWTEVWSGATNLNSYTTTFYSATVPTGSYVGKRIAIEVQYSVGTTYTSKIIFGVLGNSTATTSNTSIARGIGWNYFDGTNLRVKTLYTYASTGDTTTIRVGHLKTLFGRFTGTTIDWSTSYSETLYMRKIWVIE